MMMKVMTNDVGDDDWAVLHEYGSQQGGRGLSLKEKSAPDFPHATKGPYIFGHHYQRHHHHSYACPYTLQNTVYQEYNTK